MDISKNSTSDLGSGPGPGRVLCLGGLVEGLLVEGLLVEGLLVEDLLV
jgi:hypothetical protein